MFYYKIFLVLTILANGQASPIENEPIRCCLSERHSYKAITNAYIQLPNGTVATVTVSISLELRGQISMSHFYSRRTNMRMMVLLDYGQRKELQNFIRIIESLPRGKFTIPKKI